jgi:hypothetical protein
VGHILDICWKSSVYTIGYPFSLSNSSDNDFTAAYMVSVGIYNSARLVGANNNLRKDIYRHALRTELLDSLGGAEMERQLQKTVKEIIINQDFRASQIDNERTASAEFDEKELRKYLEQVIEEVKRDRSS